MKLCKDCKHHRGSFIGFIAWAFTLGWQRRRQFDTCVAPLTVRAIGAGGFCEIERQNWAHLPVCGPEAKFWEPRT